MKSHGSEVTSITFSPNGKVLISGNDKELKIWSSNGSLIKTISDIDQKDIYKYNKVNFDPTGEYFITSENKGVMKVWRFDGTFIRQLTGYSFPISSINFSPSGDSFITRAESWWGMSSETNLWNIDGTFKDSLDSITRGTGGLIKFHPDGSEVFISSAYGSAYPINRLSFIRKPSPSLEGHLGHISDMDFSSDGRKIVTASSDNTGMVWDRYGDQDPVHYLRGHRNPVTGIKFNQDGNTIASVDAGGIVKFWDSRNGENLPFSHDYSDQLSGSNLSLDFIGDNNSLILFNWEKAIFLNEDGSEIRSLNVLDWPQFSTINDSVAVSVQQPKLRVIDANGDLSLSLEGHTGDINSAVFSPDKKKIASASSDRTVIIWDISGNILSTLKHDAPVNSVSFSKDGKFLVTGSDDKIIRIFDSNGTPIKNKDGGNLELTGHTDVVTSVLFSPDNRILASASTDNTIRLWNTKSWEQEPEKIELSETVSNSELDVLWFSENGNILGYGTDPTSLRLLNHRMQGGIWIDEATFHPVKEIPEGGLPGGDWLTVQGNRGLIILSLGLDHSLQKACQWSIDYLKTIDEEDLCHGILKEDSSL